VIIFSFAGALPIPNLGEGIPLPIFNFGAGILSPYQIFSNCIGTGIFGAGIFGDNCELGVFRFQCFLLLLLRLDRFHLIILEIGILSSGNQVSEFLLPFNHFTRHIRVPEFVKFRSMHFNFPVPERYVYLSGTWKMKMAKPKIEGTPTVGLILKK